MSDTAARLAAYKSAELRILEAQQLGHGDRSKRLAELAEVRAAITQLETQLANEQRAAAGASGPVTMVADFSRPLG